MRCFLSGSAKWKNSPSSAPLKLASQYDSRINGLSPFVLGKHENGIDVDFLNLREIDKHVGEPDHKVCNRLDVARFLPSDALQDPSPADASDHFPGFLIG